MDMRDNWTIQEDDFTDLYYSRDETVANVRENYDVRRFRSGEGYDIKINGVLERCLVQTSSNPLRELNDFRKIHCPINADVKRGYYVEYENSVWIIDTNVVNVDGAYLSTRMSRCQYVLRWQTHSGNIVERWGYAADQTKYSNGETGNNTITYGDNQYGLLLPIDNETKLLKRGMRFSIDFDDSDEPDIYSLTNRKVKLAEGTMSITLSFDAFNPKTDKRVTFDSGKSVWICDYRDSIPTSSPVNETTVLSASISGGTSLRYGRAKSWTVSFSDKNGEIIENDNFYWNVVSDFEIPKVITNNKIQFKIDAEDLIGESFALQVIVGTTVLSEVTITITEGF